MQAEGKPKYDRSKQMQGASNEVFNSTTGAYELDSIYALIGTKTGFVLNLIIANRTILESDRGYKLRTVELKVNDYWWVSA